MKKIIDYAGIRNHEFPVDPLEFGSELPEAIRPPELPAYANAVLVTPFRSERDGSVAYRVRGAVESEHGGITPLLGGTERVYFSFPKVEEEDPSEERAYAFAP